MNKKLLCLLFFSLFLICRGNSQHIEWIVKPRYDQIGQFHDGVAAVNVAGKWGYINSKGEEIVRPEYDLTCDFNEGAGVIISSGLEVKAVADVNGRLNIPGERLTVRSNVDQFSDGLLLVTDGRKWGYINRSGNIQIACKYTAANPFSEGLAAVSTSSTGYGGWAYINPSGQGVILQDNNYTWASSFNSGKAVVILSKQLAFIDIQGKKTTGNLPRLTSLHERYDNFNGELRCKEGEVLFDWKGRMNAFKGRTGTQSFMTPDRNIADDKYIQLKTEGGKYGFIINGKEIPCQFDEVPWHDQTLAVVRKDSKFGLVSLNEGHAVSVTFKESTLFSVFGNPVQATIIVKNLTSGTIHDLEIEYPDDTRHAVGDIQANTLKELPVFLSKSNDLPSEEKEYKMRAICDGIILNPVKNKVVLEDRPSLRIENFSTDKEPISFEIINESDISLDALSIKVLDSQSKSYFDRTIPLKGKGKATCQFNFSASQESPIELEIIAKAPRTPEIKVKKELRSVPMKETEPTNGKIDTKINLK